ncbi:MAG: MFS transporter [Acidobacteria bacterium]|nr:MFS transporter [Acidobacteriota bacterium]
MKYRHRVLLLLSLLSIITYLDRVCISVAGPRIQENLHISPERWGWVTGVFAIAYGTFEMPSGYMGDRLGPRAVLTRIVLWWSAFTSLTGLASNYFYMLLTRFCFGAGEAGAYPNTSASIFRWFPAIERARAFGIIWMAAPIGGAFAPFLVVPIQARYGWRTSFYVFGLLGMAWGVVWYWWYRNTPAEMANVTKAEIEEIGAAPPQTRHALPWSIALRSGNLWAIMLLALTYVYGLYFFQSWLHTYLVKGRGFSEKELLLSTLPYVCGACANGCGGFASDALVRKFGLKRGRHMIGIIGLGSSALFTMATVLVANKFVALTFLALSYAGITLQQPTVWAVCVDIGKQYAGAVSGLMNTAAQIGAVLSSVLFGYFVKVSGSYEAPLLPMAAVLLISAALWLKIDPARELIPERKLAPSGAS